MNPPLKPDHAPAAAGGEAAAAARSGEIELTHELDRLRTANRESRAFIRATRRELRKPLNALVGILRDLSTQTADHDTANSIRTALHWTMSLGRLTNDLLELAVLQADEAEVGVVAFDVRDLVEEVSFSTRPPGVHESRLQAVVRPEVPSMLIGHPNRIRQILVAGTQHLLASRAATQLRMGLIRLAETHTHVDLLFALQNQAPTEPPLDDAALEAAVDDDFGLLVAQRMARGLGGSLELLGGGDLLQLRIQLRKSGSSGEVMDVSRAVAQAEADAAAPGQATAPALEAAPGQPTTPVREVPDRASAGHAPSPAPGQVEAPPGTPPAAPPAADAHDAPATDIAEITLKGTRVLVAGSSAPSNVALQIELRALGCESGFAATVDQAFEALLDSGRRMRPYHICVVDFSSADEGAEELVGRIRAEQELRHLQLMLLVEMGSSGDAEWAEHLGFAAYLTKPVQRDDLGAVFKELLQRSVAADPEAVRLITRHSVRETRRRRLHCLVADDDRVNLITLKTVIERLGHTVETAEGGSEALEKADMQRFDLVLSDVRMPDMDGDEVATRLISMQSRRGERPTPIFAMSANSLPGDSQRCRAAGMRNYFLKPLTLPLLAQLLRYALEDAEAANAAAPTGTPGLPAPAHETAAAPAARAVPEQEAPAMEQPEHYGEATPINLDHLEMASVGVPELRREMLSTFQLEMSAGMERLGDLIGDGNHGGVTMLASALNSTCASIGAMACSRHLAEIERRASAGELASLDTLYAESLAEWDRVRAFVTALLEEQPAPEA